MIPYQWTTAIIGLTIAGIILLLVRRDHLHGPYAVWWLATSAAVVLISLLPGVVNLLARWLGIGYPPILPVFIGMGLILIKMLTMDLGRSRQELKLRRLTQRMALLEASLEQLRKAAEPAQRPSADGSDETRPIPVRGHPRPPQ